MAVICLWSLICLPCQSALTPLLYIALAFLFPPHSKHGSSLHSTQNSKHQTENLTKLSEDLGIG